MHQDVSADQGEQSHALQMGRSHRGEVDARKTGPREREGSRVEVRLLLARHSGDVRHADRVDAERPDCYGIHDAHGRSGIDQRFSHLRGRNRLVLFLEDPRQRRGDMDLDGEVRSRNLQTGSAQPARLGIERDDVM